MPLCGGCRLQDALVVQGYWRCRLCSDVIRPATPEEIVDHGWDEEAGRPRESALTDTERNPGLA